MSPQFHDVLYEVEHCERLIIRHGYNEVYRLGLQHSATLQELFEQMTSLKRLDLNIRFTGPSRETTPCVGGLELKVYRGDNESVEYQAIPCKEFCLHIATRNRAYMNKVTIIKESWCVKEEVARKVAGGVEGR